MDLFSELMLVISHPLFFFFMKKFGGFEDILNK